MSEMIPSNEPAQQVAARAQIPGHINTAWYMACKLSKSQLIPRALQGKPEDLLVVLLKGEELGLKYMQSLGSIDVIQGKARVSAELTVALVLQSGKAKHFTLVHSDARKATYVTARAGVDREIEMSYTIEEAAQAGLIGKDNWKQHPAAMLRARASQALARAVYPEVTLGLVTPDEADEMKQRLEAAIEEAPERPRTISDLSARMTVDAQASPVEQIEPTSHHLEVTLDGAPSQGDADRAEPPLAAAAATPAAGAARTTTASNGAPKARRL